MFTVKGGEICMLFIGTEEAYTVKKNKLTSVDTEQKHAETVSQNEVLR